MSVGTWGYGTGATSAASHPFSLCIQGVDVIGMVPMDTITVSSSLSSNATLTFTIWDVTGTVATPEPWADVVFTDHTEAEVIFGGLVMGVETSTFGPFGLRMDVRCVDYGVLLDVAPLVVDLAGNQINDSLFQAFCGVTPLGGVMALHWETGGPGRIVAEMGAAAYAPFLRSTTPETVGIDLVRGVIERWADRVADWNTDEDAPADVWVTALRQLAIVPRGVTLADAPLELRVNPTTGSHIAAESITVSMDYRAIESGVYVADSDTSTGGDNSGFVYGTVNGYSVMPSTVSTGLAAASETATYGTQYLAKRTAATIGVATVTTVKNFMVSQALTVYYPGIGLDSTYAISSVSTRFLGGLQRRTELQFGGERGTVARFNRTRFARAGVTT